MQATPTSEKKKLIKNRPSALGDAISITLSSPDQTKGFLSLINNALEDRRSQNPDTQARAEVAITKITILDEILLERDALTEDDAQEACISIIKWLLKQKDSEPKKLIVTFLGWDENYLLHNINFIWRLPILEKTDPTSLTLHFENCKYTSESQLENLLMLSRYRATQFITSGTTSEIKNAGKFNGNGLTYRHQPSEEAKQRTEVAEGAGNGSGAGGYPSTAHAPVSTSPSLVSHSAKADQKKKKKPKRVRTPKNSKFSHRNLDRNQGTVTARSKATQQSISNRALTWKTYSKLLILNAFVSLAAWKCAQLIHPLQGAQFIVMGTAFAIGLVALLGYKLYQARQSKRIAPIVDLSYLTSEQQAGAIKILIERGAVFHCPQTIVPTTSTAPSLT